MAKPAFGSLGDSFSVVSLRAYLAEFISTVLFVFAGVGSSMAYSKLTGGAALDPAGLVAVAVCHGLALFVTVSIAARISGGHVNPAVSFGLSLAGQMTVLTSILYTITQLAASVVACILLKVATGGGEAIPIHALGAGVGIFQAILMEAITTFGLIYTIMATAVDPKRGSLGTIAPIAIGLIVAANILATGPFSGGSMNPARSFGPGVVSGDMTNNWIYLAGPMIGGGIAGVLYNLVFMHSDQYELAC